MCVYIYILFANRTCPRWGHASNLVFCISFENTPCVFAAYWKNNPAAETRDWREEPRMQMRSIDKCKRLTNTQHALARARARFRLNEICSAYVHKTPDLSFSTQRRNTDYVPCMCTLRCFPTWEICGEIRQMFQCFRNNRRSNTQHLPSAVENLTLTYWEIYTCVYTSRHVDIRISKNHSNV